MLKTSLMTRRVTGTPSSRLYPLECITIERLTPALVATAAVVRGRDFEAPRRSEGAKERDQIALFLAGQFRAEHQIEELDRIIERQRVNAVGEGLPSPTSHSNRSLRTEVSVAGKRNFQGRDKEAETALEIQGRRCRDKISLGNSANSGLIAGFREISVRTRMRGGAERTRTACQARSRYRTGLSRVSSAATILRSNVAERQHYPERTGIRAPLERHCALISGARGAPRSCPAGCIAEVGLR